MKLIAGSILAGFGLLIIALGRLSITLGELLESFENFGWLFGMDSLFDTLGIPIAFLAVLFIIGGIALIGWAIWEMVTKKV